MSHSCVSRSITTPWGATSHASVSAPLAISVPRMYTSALLRSVTTWPFSMSHPAAQGGNRIGGSDGSMVLMNTGLQPLSSIAFELVAHTQPTGGIVNDRLNLPRNPCSSRDIMLTVIVEAASSQPPVPLGSRVCVQLAASPYRCVSRNVGSTQAMVFFPSCSIDSWVSVSCWVVQRASMLSEAQARTEMSNSTGNA